MKNHESTDERDLVFCAECKAQGLKSRVMPGMSFSTLMSWDPYYDEEGHYHSHDPNTVTTAYMCSNAHRWQAKRKHPCPTCGARP